MISTIYLNITQLTDNPVFLDNKGNEYNLLTPISDKDVNSIKWVIKNNRCIKLTYNSDTSVVTMGTADINKFDNDFSTTPYNFPFLKLIGEVEIELKHTEVNLPEDKVSFLNFIHNECIKLKPSILKISPVKWKYLMRSVIKGKNIMITGGTGSGKTVTIQTVHKVFTERPYFYFNLGATTDPRSSLIGNVHFNKESGTYFSESAFVTAIQTPNSIIMLDELSRSHPDALNILMSVLDYGQRYLRLDEADGSPIIKVAEGVSFLSTANIGSEYTATRVIDRALLDRFTIIEMDLLNKKEEGSLLKELYPLLSKEKINAITEISTATRKEIKSEDAKISTSISTRISVEIAGLMDDGFSLLESAEIAIYPFFDDAGGIDSERTYITQLVQKHNIIEKVDIFNTGEENAVVEEQELDFDDTRPF